MKKKEIDRAISNICGDLSAYFREKEKAKAVRKVKKMTYTDGEGKKYKLKNAIVIDLTKGIPLEKLLEEALRLSEEVKE